MKSFLWRLSLLITVPFVSALAFIIFVLIFIICPIEWLLTGKVNRVGTYLFSAIDPLLSLIDPSEHKYD